MFKLLFCRLLSEEFWIFKIDIMLNKIEEASNLLFANVP